MSEKISKYDSEIQSWLGAPPKILSRYRKFYDSIVSIHLGGEGLMTLFHKGIMEGTDTKKLKSLYRNYTINHPEREEKKK